MGLGRYTTITLRREIVEELEKVKCELNAKSLGDAISRLIQYWRRMRALGFAEEVREIRRKGGLEELRRAIEEVRGLKWSRFT